VSKILLCSPPAFSDSSFFSPSLSLFDPLEGLKGPRHPAMTSLVFSLRLPRLVITLYKPPPPLFFWCPNDSFFRPTTFSRVVRLGLDPPFRPFPISPTLLTPLRPDPLPFLLEIFLHEQSFRGAYYFPLSFKSSPSHALLPIPPFDRPLSPSWQRSRSSSGKGSDSGRFCSLSPFSFGDIPINPTFVILP